MTATAPTAEFTIRDVPLKGITRIALVGPDGVGKSTVIGLIQEWFAEKLPQRKIEIRRWRPGLLPDLHSVLHGKFSRTGTDNGPVTPRRKPGPLHTVRIFYYALDYILGGWWLDRIQTAPGTVIIYDRCALDMQVDPVRFALKSAKGARLLYRIAPKPDLVILLEDSPERIYERKRELDPHEMQEQYLRWRRLAEQGIVHATVRVDAPPEEIANRIRQLLLEKLESKFGEPDRPTYDAASLEWIADVLDEGAGSAHKFAALPNASKPRVLIPLVSRAVASKGLEIYQPQKPLARLAHGLFVTGLRSGLIRMRPRVAIRMESILSYLGEVTGFSAATVSIALGTPGVMRKPVLQVMAPDGQLLAFAKVGWNRRSSARVRQEAATLKKLASRKFSTAIIPAILHARPVGSRFVRVQAAVKAPLQKSPRSIDTRHLTFLRELNCPKTALPWSFFSTPIENRLGEVRRLGYHYYLHLLEAALAFCARVFRSEPIPAGMAHGDFSPWNIVVHGDKLVVFDWEYACPNSPPGWDLLHFLIVTAIELEGRDGARLYHDLIKEGPRYFEQLGIRTEWLEPLLIAYAAEMLSRLLTMHGHAPSHIDEVTRKTLGQLLSLLLNGGGAQ
jgi:thymidylate kinase